MLPNIQRSSSPFAQTLITCVVMFCCVGLNSAVAGLGAGGSRPENIPIVDRLNYVVTFVMVGTSCFAGAVTNKLGPRVTVVIGAAGYPLYIGSLWCVHNLRLDDYLTRNLGLWIEAMGLLFLSWLRRSTASVPPCSILQWVSYWKLNRYGATKLTCKQVSLPRAIPSKVAEVATWPHLGFLFLLEVL